MKLVVLFGPPAVGKLTVAREVAARMGWRLFHNYLAVDVALSVHLQICSDFAFCAGPETSNR